MSTNNMDDINQKKLDKIKFEILRLEDENSKTKDYTYGDMVEKIKQTIKDGVDGKLMRTKLNFRAILKRMLL